VTVGESLAQVRDTAGLSVDEVSGRTGIRETVIRAIERDDFDALGGDLYVRGYLRAITAALGIDPQPLIREFDAGRAASAAPASAMPSLASATVEPTAAPTVEPAAEDYSSLWWADDAVSDADPLPDDAAPWPSAPEPAHRSQPDDIAQAGPARPARTAATQPVSTPATRARPATRKRSRPARRSRVRGWRWAITVGAFAAVVLAIVGVATSQIVSKLSSPGHAGATATPAVQAAAAGGSPTASVASPSAASPAASKTAATPTPKATTTQSPAVRLAVAQASAFGPDGVADGDNAQSAGNVITPGSSRPWLSDWYATATFGMLKTGTGLLLDMGRTVTVTSVQIRLGGIAGANLQVRAGDAASLSGTRVVASARDAAGTLTLRLKAPAGARYVIIWFTGLPPSGSGNYQATVYSVAVMGRP